MSSRQLIFVLFPAVLALFLNAAVIWADDSAIYGESGAIQVMHGHPSIRMVSEVVKIKLPEGHVDATFVFRNEGPATTVTMGFPEHGNAWPPGHIPSSPTKGFQSWVDGKSIHVSRVVPKQVDETVYDLWWVKRVHFAAQQTRVVRDTYTGGSMYVDPSGLVGYYYVLKTGASWHGPIGEAKIVCDIGALRGDRPLMFQPRSGRKLANKIVWDIRNFKPTQDVILGWDAGYEAVTVNGKRMWFTDVYYHGELDPGSFGWDDQDYGEIPAALRGDDLWVTAVNAAKWLGATVKQIDTGRIEFERGSAHADVTVGSALIRTDSNLATPMPQPAAYMTGAQVTAYEVRIQNTVPGQRPSDLAEIDSSILNHLEQAGYTMLYFRPLVEALGGSSRWDRTTDTLLVTMPPLKP